MFQWVVVREPHLSRYNIKPPSNTLFAFLLYYSESSTIDDIVAEDLPVPGEHPGAASPAYMPPADPALGW
jgi:hypothetical protein